MKKVILASNNQKKVSEIKEILKGIEVKSLKDENIFIDVVEDGNTFEENSKKKATEIAKYLKEKGEKEFVVMADDSGLSVDYLNGAPGIYSARYAGEHGNDSLNNKKLLEELKGVPLEKREASFICFISIVNDKGEYIGIKGEVRGTILEELEGEEGFGYDPLFYYAPYKKTFAQMSSEEKNRISHRGRALDELKRRIEEVL
ncbi:XTP/dITP diphosphatase [Clostridium sp. MSJ-8]|uniref:XTP/dITP diphosphatase n=1 Tax=Clostridium sp. MSJ-8 TaxID=2841510 RepID=UPI001C0ECE06|nr:XTP/dITP diphosphatase [Clostridium sp. MSJ-8]MBU5488196.1 XTP/dITP diphosphatase [Clostridium sp. MSJ-8]